MTKEKKKVLTATDVLKYLIVLIGHEKNEFRMLLNEFPDKMKMANLLFCIQGFHLCFHDKPFFKDQVDMLHGVYVNFNHYSSSQKEFMYKIYSTYWNNEDLFLKYTHWFKDNNVRIVQRHNTNMKKFFSYILKQEPELKEYFLTISKTDKQKIIDSEQSWIASGMMTESQFLDPKITETHNGNTTLH